MDADDLYSLTLLLALCAGPVVLLASCLRWKHTAAIGSVSLVAGIAGLAVSVLVHLRWGHGAGSVAPMPLPAFLSEHPAFWIAALLLSVAALLKTRAHRRSRRNTPDD